MTTKRVTLRELCEKADANEFTVRTKLRLAVKTNPQLSVKRRPSDRRRRWEWEKGSSAIVEVEWIIAKIQSHPLSRANRGRRKSRAT